MTTSAEPSATALVRLATWLSPAFPTGAFAYSGGLEAAFSSGQVDRSTLTGWVEDLLRSGSLRQEAVLCALSARGFDVSGLALALVAAPERREETLAQGEAFARAATAWNGDWPDDAVPLPCAVGRAARLAGLPLEETLAVFVQSQTSNIMQAAQRLGMIGQREGVALQARLEPLVVETARFACRADESDIGACTLAAEIAALRHSTLSSRIFRS